MRSPLPYHAPRLWRVPPPKSLSAYPEARLTQGPPPAGVLPPNRPISRRVLTTPPSRSPGAPTRPAFSRAAHQPRPLCFHGLSSAVLHQSPAPSLALGLSRAAPRASPAPAPREGWRASLTSGGRPGRGRELPGPRRCPSGAAPSGSRPRCSSRSAWAGRSWAAACAPSVTRGRSTVSAEWGFLPATRGWDRGSTGRAPGSREVGGQRRGPAGRPGTSGVRGKREPAGSPRVDGDQPGAGGWSGERDGRRPRPPAVASAPPASGLCVVPPRLGPAAAGLAPQRVCLALRPLGPGERPGSGTPWGPARSEEPVLTGGARARGAPRRKS